MATSSTFAAPAVRRSCIRTILTLLMCWTLFSVTASETCVLGKTTEANGRKFPDLTTQSFKAELTGVMLSDKSALHVREYYSVEDGRGAAYFEAAYNYKYFYLTDEDGVRAAGLERVCGSTSSESVIGDIIHTTRTSLSLDNMTFFGPTKVGGVPVNRWRKCVPYTQGSNGDERQFVASFDVLITKSDSWEMYNGGKRDVLMRLAVKSYSEDEVIENYYLDFLDFEKVEYDADKYVADLEAPLGAVCEGIPQKLQPPSVPKSVSFWRETVTELYDSKFVSNFDYVIMDTDNQVIERQMGTSTAIRDFKSGASYLIFRLEDQTATCMVLGVNNLQASLTAEDFSAGFTLKDHYVTIDSVEEYFYLKGNFTFNGEYDVRGIPCNVFTQVVENYGDKNVMASIMLYFTKPGVSFIGATDISESKLVKVQVEVENDAVMTFNIIEIDAFDSDKTMEEPYDVSLCFHDEQRIEFVLELEDDNPKVTMTGQQRHNLERATRKQIAKLANLNLLRVRIGKIVEGQGSVYLPGSLFARPKSGTHFDYYEGKSFSFDTLDEASDRIITLKSGVIRDLEACADFAQSEILATEADFCEDLGYCVLYRAPLPGQQELKMVTDNRCTHLVKIKGYNTLTTLDEAWDTLEEEIFNKNFEIKVGDKVFKASSIDRSNDNNEIFIDDPAMSKFRKTASLDIKSTEEQILQNIMSVAECAEQCINNLLFPCEAFKFCAHNSLCELHNAFPHGTSESAYTTFDSFSSTISTGCVVYARSYLDNFERRRGPAGNVPTSASDPEYTAVKHPENCAKLCLETNDFQCESFDFCSKDGSVGNCILRTYHWRDEVSNVKEKPVRNCTQYSRNYLWDFSQMEGVTKLPVRNTLQKVGGAEACAYKCSASSECKAFHFCETDDVCQFIDTETGPPKVKDLVPKFRCYTFTQKQEPDVLGRSDKLRERLSRSQSSGSGYSDGAMAGLAIGHNVAKDITEKNSG
ncbi:antigen b membrane protein [Plakobranchus ocellatus]|uniref:Antigen b membrane protein n=1 Tax=Plakobranchus ocellatus TaxID=259542 RepID=A0AAV4BFL7_9GAST|nr:antigen b membrane protein [Plakobranchus ocellatus]